jgi:5-methyltetrahydropteroyltriglutamate--homocysteine methyltransferase
MAERTKPPFRAEHVGSLLRPPALKRAREEHEQGTIDDAELRRREDEAIGDAVRMQEEIGLQAVTDGEFRRGSWHMDFIYELGGFVESAEHDFTTLASLATTATPKLTIPSPSMVHYRGGRAAIDESVYPDLDEFWADVANAYREEVRRLYDLGCRYLQLDDTCFAYLNDPEQRAALSARGDDADHLHLRYIEYFNAAVRDRPADLTIATHTCRGNFRSSWVADGSYDFVAEPLLTELDVDGFFLEYDDERSGGFEPLRFLPKDKVVVLGLVTTKRPELESKDGLKRRIEEATRHVPLEQLCLSPQCGFSSTADGNALTYEQQLAKLQLVVETAEEVWG